MKSKKQSKSNALMEALFLTDDPMEVFGITTEYELIYFIQDIEKIIRTSREYRAFIYMTKKKHDQAKDVFTGYDSYEYDLTLEIHHVIFLRDIVYVTGSKMIDELKEGECYSTFQIADQVIRDHFEGIIPIVPMLKSFHEMYHERLIEFTKKDIYGDYQKWLDKYEKYITEEKMIEFKSNLLMDLS